MAVSTILNHNPTDVSPIKNQSYVGDGNVYVEQYGKMVVMVGRFNITTKKPSGQGNYLFNGLPIPKSDIAYVANGTGIGDLFINGSGQFTSNSEIQTGYMNVSCAYVCK